MPTKVSIIGAGNVGTATTFTLALSGSAEQIVLLDKNLAKAQGEIMDIAHGSPFLPYCELKATANYKDIKNSDIVVITAGAKQAPGETRLDLLKRNSAILKAIVLNIKRYAPKTIILVVVNPVDILTYLAHHYSGFPKQRVFGSGTVLDTARFRSTIAQQFKVNAHNVHAYILGEHGDSSFPALSTAAIGAVPLNKLAHYNKTQLQHTHQQVVQAAYNIIKKKGYTNSAIALCVNQLVRTVLKNSHEVFSVSSTMNQSYGLYNVALSTPVILGRAGIEQILTLPLNHSEQIALRHSATILKKAIVAVR